MQRYRGRKKEIPGLEVALVDQAWELPRFGCKRLTVILRRLGFMMNHKRTYLSYTRLELAVRRKRRQRA